MTKINFKEQIELLNKIQENFITNICIDITNLSKKFNCKSPEEFDKDLIHLSDNICREDFIDKLDEVKLSNYFEDVDVIENITENRHITYYVNLIDNIEFLYIKFSHIRDDYYGVYICLMPEYIENEDINFCDKVEKILKDNSISEDIFIILDQKKELNMFIKQLNKLLG